MARAPTRRSRPRKGRPAPARRTGRAAPPRTPARGPPSVRGPHRPRAQPPSLAWIPVAEARAPPAVRFIGWSYLLLGLTSLTVGLVVLALVEFAGLRLADDEHVRTGLSLAVAFGVPLNLLAILAGLNLLLLREWARLAAAAVAAVGLFLAVGALATALFGDLLSNRDLGPPWFLGLAVTGTVVLGGFFAWTLPALVRPKTAALFR